MPRPERCPTPHVLCGCGARAQVDGAPPPKPGTPEYSNFNDTYGHGTHTAGLIGAVGNNKRGVAGVAWRVQLLVCRFIWDDGSGYIRRARGGAGQGGAPGIRARIGDCPPRCMAAAGWAARERAPALTGARAAPPVAATR